MPRFEAFPVVEFQLESSMIRGMRLQYSSPSSRTDGRLPLPTDVAKDRANIVAVLNNENVFARR
jgi:hypothetical protein